MHPYLIVYPTNSNTHIPTKTITTDVCVDLKNLFQNELLLKYISKDQIINNTDKKGPTGLKAKASLISPWKKLYTDLVSPQLGHG